MKPLVTLILLSLLVLSYGDTVELDSLLSTPDSLDSHSPAVQMEEPNPPRCDTLYAEGGTGDPLFLPPLFIIPTSVALNSLDSVPLPPWQYFWFDGSIRFESPLRSSGNIEVCYDTEYKQLQRSYSLFDPVIYDSTVQVEATDLYGTVQAPTNQNIEFSGEKSVGAHLGQDGSFSMDQTLDVELYGDIGDSTTLSANITDKSSSLQGDTKELGALDRVYLTVANPRWSVTAGDLEITTDSTGIIRERKAPKGVAGMFRGNWGEMSLFGGYSGDRLAVEYMSGVSGAQSGSYKLKGNGEAGTILPIEGSVVLTVEGETLTEGADGDFTIDYLSGQIRFTPKFTILDDYLIEIRYRYSVFNYRKIVGGAEYMFSDSASPLQISTSILVENDNLSSNEQSLTAAEKDSLINSGDRAPKILSGRKVNPNDVTQESARSRLYTLDVENSSYLWESSPVEQALVKDLYLVSYSKVDTGGEYLPYSDGIREKFTSYDSYFLDSIAEASADSLYLQPIYLFVGSGLGTHSSYHFAALPGREVEGELSVKWNPSEQVNIATIVAGRSIDKNTLSSIDDSNNQSAGFRSKMKFSTPVDNLLIVSTNVEASYAGTEFVDDISNRYELERKWGIPVDTSRFATIYGDLVGEINRKVELSVGSGVSRVDNSPFSHILSTGLTISPTVHNENRYYFHSLQGETEESETGRRQEFSTSLTFPAIESRFELEEEWLERTATVSAGYLRGRAELLFPKINWSNSVEYKRNAAGEQHYSAEELETHLLWEQAFDHRFGETREVELSTSLLSQKGGERESVALLLSLIERSRHLDNRFATELNYSISSDNSSLRRWQYNYVGEGVGTHSRDPITGEFLPDPFGDYTAEEIVLWSDGTTLMIQNNFLYRWSYKTASRGTAADGLSFEGVLSSIEDIVPEERGISRGWLPLASTFGTENKDTLRYSLINYNQIIGWKAPSLNGFSVRFSGTVSQKRDLSTEIRHIDGLFGVRKKWERFALDGSVRGVREQRNLFDITDASVDPLQEFFLTKSWTIFLEESFGYTALADSAGNYISARPGIRYRSMDIGTAELSYTIADLLYDGPIVYPMARDFKPGMNHRIYLNLRLNAGKYFRFNGFLRADYLEGEDWKIMTSLRATVQI